ncbi:MAG: hypothetical protein EBR51_00290 [Gammaproteobacteria bacterium]|nr:hypothetical protein [Gammaproteobacteria bacterium]
MLSEDEMPKMSKSREGVAQKPSLGPSYKDNDPRTLRQRERAENERRKRNKLGNWPDSQGFLPWGSRNKELRERRRKQKGTERTASGLTLRQLQFLEDTEHVAERGD